MTTTEAEPRKDAAREDTPAPGWRAIIRRAVKEFQNDNLTDWAAALTYYAILALFPALLVLVALVGLLGQYPQTTNDLIDILKNAGADPRTLDSLKSTINGIVTNKGGAGALLGIGLAGALWSASGYIGAFMRASNAIYETPEGRPVWKLRPLQVVVTLAMTLLFALVLVAIVVTGPLAHAVGDKIGLGHTAVTVWNIAKWPVLAFIVSVMLATLYHVAPNAKLPKFQWISAGAAVALVVWVLASLGFFFYASKFGSYNKTYGTLGGMISLLVWMWITNIAILFGQELNAEIERARELAAGKPAIEDIQLPLRDEPKKDPEDEAAQISRDAVAPPEPGNGGAEHDEAVAQLDKSATAAPGTQAARGTS
jgi:membrane protein